MRRPLRLFLLAGVLGVTLAATFAVIAALTPAGPPAEIPIARAETVTDAPRLLRVPELRDLSAIARQGRWRTGMPWGDTTRLDARGLYLARDEGGAVRAFLAADPRNGCALDWIRVAMSTGPSGATYEQRFHDVCHGSLYDRNGTPAGGPGPWALDEAVISVRDGVVFVRTREVRTGVWLADRGSALQPACDITANVRSVGPAWSFSVVPLRAGREELIGQVYSGPFAVRAHPGVSVGGMPVSARASAISDVLAVGDTVCLKLRKGVATDPLAFDDYVLTDVSIRK